MANVTLSLIAKHQLHDGPGSPKYPAPE